jgi:putative DNA primase/helicase
LSLRILGKTENVTTLNSAMYFATGNNLVISGDVARRALRCTIDAQCERPEDRQFNTMRPGQLAMTNRAEYVVTGLIIMRAFFVAGCPMQTNPLGSFERWSRTVRDCLIWLGEPDPCATMEAIRQDDPTIERDITALAAWFNSFEDHPISSKEVVEKASERGQLIMGSGVSAPYSNRELRDALQTITDNRLDTRQLGEWISRMKDRIIGGYKIKPAGSKDGYKRWQVKWVKWVSLSEAWETVSMIKMTFYMYWVKPYHLSHLTHF